MTQQIDTNTAALSRKKRLVITGEFSSGKSQLINGLLGHKLLPSNVTSTSLPPIWVIHGEGAGIHVDLNEVVTPLTSLEDIDVEKTLFCVLKSNSPFLENCDLIDTPGNSDPNIPSVCWERMLGYADALVWCSNSVQAWRQSEKSVWDGLDVRYYHQATMILTHADRLVDPKSAAKVQRRVCRDAAEYFEHFLMSSLISEKDVSEIRSLLLDKVLPNLEMHGKAQPNVDELRNGSRPVTAETTPPAQAARSVMPRRPNQIRKMLEQAKSKNEAKLAASQDKGTEDSVAAIVAGAAVGEQSGFENVTQLFDRGAEAPSVARAIWQQTRADKPLSTPEEWAVAVEEFLTRLDQKFATETSSQPGASGTDVDVSALVLRKE